MTNVDLRPFSVGPRDFSRAGVDFTGRIACPFPDSVQAKDEHIIAGWACGVFMARNALAFMGITPGMEQLVQVARQAGGDESIGTDGIAIQNLFRHFGLRVVETAINDIARVRQVTERGGLVVTTNIGHDWDKLHRSPHQTFDGHWIFLAGADSTQVLVVDSDLAERGPGKTTYGVYSVPWLPFAARNYDFDTNGQSFLSVSSDYVWGQSSWYHQDALEVYKD